VNSPPADLPLPTQPRPLPLLHTPHKLPRTARAAVITAPGTPFADPAPVLAAITELGSAARADYQPDQGLVAVDCAATALPRLAALLPPVGTAGLVVRVQLDAWPDEAGAAGHVRTLADAGIDALSVTAPPTTDLVGWFELSKAALTHGLPLYWTGGLPDAVRSNARHLTPARDDPDGRAQWRYASLTWRRGPGYAAVEDALNPDERRQIVLTLPPLASAFGPELGHSAAVAEIDSALTTELVDLGFAAVVAGRVVWLPYRIHRWPATIDR
jgi:hypothetical protein